MAGDSVVRPPEDVRAAARLLIVLDEVEGKAASAEALILSREPRLEPDSGRRESDFDSIRDRPGHLSSRERRTRWISAVAALASASLGFWLLSGDGQSANVSGIVANLLVAVAVLWGVEIVLTWRTLRRWKRMDADATRPPSTSDAYVVSAIDEKMRR